MKHRKWKIRSLGLLLLMVLLTDGALAGTAFAVARHLEVRTDAWQTAGSQRLGGHSGLLHSPGGRSAAVQPSDSPSSTAPPFTAPSSTAPSSTAPPSTAQLSTPQPSTQSPSAAQPLQVALTFDDGPHQTCTPALLDGLKQRGVKATFFLMGDNIAGQEALVQRMQEEGHLIGNHSYRHIQMTKEGAEQACAEIEQTEEIIRSITGSRPEYLRPPYGAWNEQLECRVNLTTVLWNVDSLDWKLQNTERIVRQVEKDVKSGDIILMHDIFKTSVEAALRIVDDLQKQGYEFVTVEELMVD